MATRTSLMEFQIPKIVHEEVDENRGVFVIEPLDRGFGYTFGNSLRRVLLSSLEGAAVTSVKIEGVAHRLLRGRAGPERDDVVRANLVARDVHAAAVDLEVAVADELAGLRARGGEAEPVDDVVEPRLEHPQQLLARHAGALGRLLVVGAELGLEETVVPARLLLLAQLQQVLGLLDAAAAVLAGRVAAALDGALLRQAALALEEELHPLTAADAALRSQISGH